MQVEVVGRTDDGLVTVKSTYGTFSAQWQDDEPEVGSSHWVELDVVRVSGLVTDFGADDVLIVDLDGSHLMIDTDGDPPLGVVGRYVTVRARDVRLFPYDL